jgi:hypothetical protein
MHFLRAIRPGFGWLLLFVLGFAPGFVARTGAVESSPTASPPAPPPITDERRAAFPLLRELDRFLDHHPLIENDLRLDVTLLENEAYLNCNPPLRQFVATHPTMGSTLRNEPRHLLHRALLREANVPLKWSEAAQIDAFLDQHPVIGLQLVTDPMLIRSAGFLAAEPQLRAFLAQNAALSRGFLPPGPSF